MKKEIDFNKIPYFEAKVVRVKKVKKEEHKYSIYCDDCKKYIKFNFPYHTCVTKKGNFVNGENLDKIKFPCLCSYKIKTFVNIGQLNKGRMGYELCYIGEQDKRENIIDGCGKLENLIKAYDIHILKGEIIIFEEVK